MRKWVCWIVNLVCLRACVIACFACPRAWVLTCSVFLRAYVLACLACLRAHVFACWACLRAHVFRMVACVMPLRARMPYMLDLLQYFTCLRACVLLRHRLSYFLYIWKVKFQKFLYIENYIFSEKYLEQPHLNIYKGVFAEETQRLKDLIIFAKRVHHRFLTAFYTHFIFIDTNLKTYIWNQFKGSSEVNINQIILQLFWSNINFSQFIY